MGFFSGIKSIFVGDEDIEEEIYSTYNPPKPPAAPEEQKVETKPEPPAPPKSAETVEYPEKRDDSATARRTQNQQRRSSILDKPDRAYSSDRLDRDRSDRSYLSDRSERSDRAYLSDRSERSDRAYSSDRSERSDRSYSSDRSERSERSSSDRREKRSNSASDRYSSDRSSGRGRHKERESDVRMTPTEQSSFELVLARPNNFKEVSKIGEDINDGRTVIINLELVKQEDATRILDFIWGVAFANEAEIKMMAQKTYAVIPPGVNFTGVDLVSELENNGYTF